MLITQHSKLLQPSSCFSHAFPKTNLHNNFTTNLSKILPRERDSFASRSVANPYPNSFICILNLTHAFWHNSTQPGWRISWNKICPLAQWGNIRTNHGEIISVVVAVSSWGCVVTEPFNDPDTLPTVSSCDFAVEPLWHIVVCPPAISEDHEP